MHPWQTRASGVILNSLLEKQLLQSDGQGGIEVPLVYRQQIYRQLTKLEQQQAHRQGRVAAGGAYRAAYQAASGRKEAALWQTHQQRELGQGQAAAAYAIFQPLISDGTSALIREQAQLICAKIDMLHGQSERVLQQLTTKTISTEILAVEAGELLGMAANDHSEFTQAELSFNNRSKWQNHWSKYV